MGAVHSASKRLPQKASQDLMQYVTKLIISNERIHIPVALLRPGLYEEPSHFIIWLQISSLEKDTEQRLGQ